VDLVRSESSRRRREAREARLRAESGYDIEREVWDMAVAEGVRTAGRGGRRGRPGSGRRRGRREGRRPPPDTGLREWGRAGGGRDPLRRRGYLVKDNLRPLPTGGTYQLWALGGPDPISAGVLGRDPGVVAFTVDPSASGLAITPEREGGVVAPEHPPVAAAEEAVV
jgi:hypothetical protein